VSVRAAARIVRAALMAASLALFVACAGMPERLSPGTTRAEIEQRLGRPTAEQPVAGGTQLQYSRQPAGQQVYNLRLDAEGRLLQVEQVMDRAAFDAIGVDRWTRDDVLSRFGRPALVERVARFNGDIWTYRFLETTMPRQAHIHIDPAGTVRRVMFTDEYPPEPPDWTP
jgi:outer membrane protein assembly factor BamE (lipoprotein component of BamABCDE complex)